MTRPNSPNTALAAHTTLVCRSCGQSFPPSQFPISDLPICLACWQQSGHRAGAQARSQVMQTLAERARIGRARGNARAVCYPHGIDVTLKRTLERLREFQIEVRISVMDDPSIGSGSTVYDGHLRRVESHEDDWTGYWTGSLGFFADVRDREPTYALDDLEYARITTIFVMDELLIDGDDPQVIWVGPHGLSALAAERRLALLLLAHLMLIFAVIVGTFFPFLFAALNHRVSDSITWGLIWWFASVLISSTLCVWEQCPRLSLLWTRNSQDS